LGHNYHHRSGARAWPDLSRRRDYHGQCDLGSALAGGVLLHGGGGYDLDRARRPAYYIDFGGTPWHGSQPDGTWYPETIVSGPTDDVILVGNVPAQKIQPGTTRTFTHCVYNGNPPPIAAAGPDTDTDSATSLAPNTNLPYYACAFATVTGHFTAWGWPQFVGSRCPSTGRLPSTRAWSTG
jgi:hypothetical protein